MKGKYFTLMAGFLLSAFVLTSCSNSKSSTKKYPYPGSPVPQERKPSESPSDKDASEEKNSNAAHPTNLPPGQAKKIYGEKSAKVFAPGQRKKQGNAYYPLIIIRTPQIIILKHADGRYYYKNADNFIYWKGNDDRFYLEEQFLDQVEYDKNELDDWKAKGNADGKKIPPGQQKKQDEEKEHGNGKGNKKPKKD